MTRGLRENWYSTYCMWLVVESTTAGKRQNIRDWRKTFKGHWRSSVDKNHSNSETLQRHPEQINCISLCFCKSELCEGIAYCYCESRVSQVLSW